MEKNFAAIISTINHNMMKLGTPVFVNHNEPIDNAAEDARIEAMMESHGFNSKYFRASK
jgi:hypothetical protein